MAVDPAPDLLLDTLFAVSSIDRDEDFEEYMAELRASDPGLASAVAERLASVNDPIPGLDDDPGIVALRTAYSPIRDVMLNRELDPGEESSLPETVGEYRVLEEVGVGGSSRVYKAVPESKDYENIVAIKVLRDDGLGLHAAERMRQERQILAGLRHPNIAHLLDGGVTGSGQHFVVTEFVEGIDIDDYCDAHRLDLQARVELFLEVCDAVAHAHTRPVVHRDLKPSNLLVSDAGQVKLLDFGIARVVGNGQPSSLTEAGFSPMTVQYASPEQVEGTEISTRTDVYALGMVLYTLLTGRYPYPLDGDQPTFYYEAIRKREPIPLARAFGSDAEALSTAAERRSVAPRQLRRQLSGDLDAVVRKALEKQPADRYQAVAELVSDLRAVLANQPVSAKTLTTAYRARKFWRRNRVAVAASAAIVTMVFGFALHATHQQRRERAARQAAEQANHTNDVVLAALTDALHLSEKAPKYLEEISIPQLVATVESVMHALGEEPEAKGRLGVTIGVVQRDLGKSADAERLLRYAIPRLEGEQKVIALTELGGTLARKERYELALDVLDEARALCRTLASACGPTVNEYAMARFAQGHVVEAEALLRDNVAALDSGRNPLELAEAQTNLAIVLGELEGRFEDSIAMAEASLAIREELLGSDHLWVAESYNNLGIAAGRQGRLEVAESYFRRSLTIRQHRLGADHPFVLQSLKNLGQCLRRMPGREDEAEAALRQALGGYEAAFGIASAKTLGARQNLAYFLMEAGELGEAEELLKDVLLARENGAAPKTDLGKTLLALGRLHLQPEHLRARASIEELTRAESLLAEGLGTASHYVWRARALRSLGEQLSGRSTAACAGLEELAAATSPTHRNTQQHQELLSRHGITCT